MAGEVMLKVSVQVLPGWEGSGTRRGDALQTSGGASPLREGQSLVSTTPSYLVPLPKEWGCAQWAPYPVAGREVTL